jgi:ABC-type multidrug transport system fused ATPase/permease subunit
MLAVTGRVGEGKSSLINAILGEMELVSGDFHREPVTIGYIAQKPFLVSGTVLENIVVERPWCAVRFAKVIAWSALTSDLELFPDREHTLLGERGTTLSGGQQQRVAIARALYGRPTLLVADDPLAAVDAEVANTIFASFAQYCRSGGTLVMALNQSQYLPYFDQSIQMQQGKVEAIEITVPAPFAAIAVSSDEPENTPASSTTAVRPAMAVPSAAPAAEEGAGDGAGDAEVERARVKGGAVFMKYVKSMGYVFTSFCLLATASCYGAMAWSDNWLAHWVDQKKDPALDDTPYAQFYGFICGLFFLLSQVGSISFAGAAVRASRSLHRQCLETLLHAPLGWYDDTPSGKILSRFSADLSTIDIHLPHYVDNVVQFALTLVVLALVLVALIPFVAIALVVSMPVFVFQTIAVERSNRSVKRMANEAMSPVLSTISECASGRSTIAVMRLQPFFTKRFHAQVDEFNRFNFVSSSLINWGMMVSYVVSMVISATTAALLIDKRAEYEDSIIGLSLTYSFLFPYYLLYFSFNYIQLMQYLLSLERLLEYCNLPGSAKTSQVTDNNTDARFLVPQEPDWYLDTDPGSPAEWLHAAAAEPTRAGSGGSDIRGAIVFTDVSMSYKPHLPPALRGVSFSVAAREKVGIVGRTGAGKSTLTLLLFRIVEASSGTVVVDGRDVTALGLQTLRQCMGIIPQHPLLLAGSVKHNLDPFQRHSDAEVLGVMAKVGLGPALIDAEVGSGGSSALSAGQQQLVSFARLLLRRVADPQRVPIVVMDEPTSNIDKATDATLQKLVRLELKDATVMTIAHRLHTVIDFNRVMVMGAGKVLEFGRPAALLEDTAGELSQMVAALGATAAAALKSRVAPLSSSSE